MDITKAKYVIVSAVFFFASLTFVRTTYNLLNSNKRLEDLRVEVRDLEEQKLAYKNELDFKKSDEFIEYEARNKLNLVKPNEELFVVDSNEIRKVTEANSENYVVLGAQDSQKSNLSLWLELVF